VGWGGDHLHAGAIVTTMATATRPKADIYSFPPQKALAIKLTLTLNDYYSKIKIMMDA